MSSTYCLTRIISNKRNNMFFLKNSLLNVTSLLLHLLVILLTTDAVSENYWENQFYERCSETGIFCAGDQSNCLSSQTCNYAGSWWEDDTDIWTSMMGPTKGKPYVAVIGFAPFEKEGNNLAAKCKPKWSLADFRIIFYKMKKSEIPAGLDQLRVWGGGTFGFPKDDGSWQSKCRSILKGANGYYGKYYNANTHLILNGEYVHLSGSVYPEDLAPFQGELAGFFDSAQYSSTDFKVFKNY